jgi:hypothetical protein
VNGKGRGARADAPKRPTSLQVTTANRLNGWRQGVSFPVARKLRRSKTPSQRGSTIYPVSLFSFGLGRRPEKGKQKAGRSQRRFLVFRLLHCRGLPVFVHVKQLHPSVAGGGAGWAAAADRSWSRKYFVVRACDRRIVLRGPVAFGPPLVNLVLG